MMATKMRFKLLPNRNTAAVDFVDFDDVDDYEGRQEEFFKLLSKHNMLSIEVLCQNPDCDALSILVFYSSMLCYLPQVHH